MKSTDLQLALSFLRVCWKPSEGDRVILHKDGLYLRGRIDCIKDNLCLVTQHPGHFYLPQELKFVPPRSAYVNFLTSFADRGLIKLQQVSTPTNSLYSDIWRLTRRLPNSIMYIEGNLIRLVAGLLEGRVVDPELNIIINESVALMRKDSSGIAPQNILT